MAKTLENEADRKVPLGVPVPAAILARLDRYRAAQGNPPSRGAAARDLLEAALDAWEKRGKRGAS